MKRQNTEILTHGSGIDIIPDIHGQLHKLEALLTKLGYHRQAEGGWGHPGRKVLFLGDYIDRGPRIRETLDLVRAMVNSGHAVALMGNHEFNAVAYHTRDDVGRPLRPHTPKNTRQHQATLDDFAGREEEFLGYLEWFKGLPMFLELDGLRAINACWSEEHLELLEGRSLHDREFLIKAASERGSREYEAVETILKGPEVILPNGMRHITPDGKERPELRVRWWGLNGGDTSVADLVMPPGALDSNEMIPSEVVRAIPNLAPGSKQVFFGHYWLPAERPKIPLAPGICCLDFSAGRSGPLVAYRWNGETSLSEANFVEQAG